MSASGSGGGAAGGGNPSVELETAADGSLSIRGSFDWNKCFVYVLLFPSPLSFTHMHTSE